MHSSRRATVSLLAARAFKFPSVITKLSFKADKEQERRHIEVIDISLETTSKPRGSSYSRTKTPANHVCKMVFIFFSSLDVLARSAG